MREGKTARETHAAWMRPSAVLAACELSRDAAVTNVAAGVARIVSAASKFVANNAHYGWRIGTGYFDSTRYDPVHAADKLKMAAALTLASCVMLGDRWPAARPIVYRGYRPGRLLLAFSACETLALRPASQNEDDRSAPGENNSDRIVNVRVWNRRSRPSTGQPVRRLHPWRLEAEAVRHWPFYRRLATSGSDGRFHLTFTRSETRRKIPGCLAAGRDGGSRRSGLAWSEIGASLAGYLTEDSSRFPAGSSRCRCAVKTDGRNQADTADTKSNAGAGDGLIGSPGEFKSCRGPLPAPPPGHTGRGPVPLDGSGRDRRVELVLEGPTIPHQARARRSAIQRWPQPAAFEYRGNCSPLFAELSAIKLQVNLWLE